MSKFYSLLIVLVIVLTGALGVYFLSNQKMQNQADLNLGQTPTPTSVIINPPAKQENASTGANMDNFTVTADGLRIQDEIVGNGKEAKSGDTVTVNYLGTLENGTKFDSSYDRNAPFTTQIGVGQVIKGWDEGIVGMKVGGKRKLIIPPNLGYGQQGAGSVIPPNATLVFEVELLNVK